MTSLEKKEALFIERDELQNAIEEWGKSDEDHIMVTLPNVPNCPEMPFPKVLAIQAAKDRLQVVIQEIVGAS